MSSVGQLTAMRIVGPGRAGRSFAQALTEVGVGVELLDRSAEVAASAADTDAVLLCVPDAEIAAVAALIEPGPAVLLHCSGATGVDALAPYPRSGSVHPLMALPDPTTGAARLRSGGWFAVDGDPMATTIVELLGGRSFAVADSDRAGYHATAAVAANHLVALLAQVERLAERVGVPVEAFLDLAQGSFDDVRAHGASASLTGPASRGDKGTLGAHRLAIGADEVALYDALADAAATLAQARRSTLGE